MANQYGRLASAAAGNMFVVRFEGPAYHPADQRGGAARNYSAALLEQTQIDGLPILRSTD